MDNSYKNEPPRRCNVRAVKGRTMDMDDHEDDQPDTIGMMEAGVIRHTHITTSRQYQGE